MTHTYATLEVAPETIADLRSRLLLAVGPNELKNHYTLNPGDKDEVTLLPGVGLYAKPPGGDDKPFNLEAHYAYEAKVISRWAFSNGWAVGDSRTLSIFITQNCMPIPVNPIAEHLNVTQTFTQL